MRYVRVPIALTALVFAAASHAQTTDIVDPTAGMTAEERAWHVRQMMIDLRRQQGNGETGGAETTVAPAPARTVTAPAPSADDTMREGTERALSQLLGGPAPAEPEIVQETTLQAQSEQVASILSAYNTGGASLDEIRGELSTLVRQARASGKQDEYVASLIREATRANLASIPAALKSPETGQVDTATLLKGIVAEVEGGDGDQYLASLQSAAPSQSLNTSSTPEAATGQTRIVTVQPGDTLSRISARVYGEAFKFEAIFNANRDILSSPDVIQAGMKLRIP